MTYPIDTVPGREITVDTKKYLYFGGTSYLGLPTDIDFQDIFIGNIKRYGTSYGASRLSNVRISVYGQAEAHLANWVGSEACITLSSGYLAGQLIAQTLSSRDHQLFYAKGAHAAMYQKTPFLYGDFDHLNQDIRAFLSSGKKATPVVFIDAIDFGSGQHAYFEGLRKLPLDQLILVVDDSHAIGVMGDEGSGSFKQLTAMNAKEVIVCCSLGKGLGIQAGALFGNLNRLQTLTATTFFAGASPASPAALGSYLQALGIYAEKRKKLQENRALFLSLLVHTNQFKYTQDHPAFSFSDVALAGHLEKNGIIVTFFGYPIGSEAPMGRIVLSAHHTTADIMQLARVLNNYFD